MSATDRPTTLNDRFQPIFDRIAASAVEREEARRLPFEEIGWLRDAGFGAVRVPVEYGGDGASLQELFALLVELGRADSNLPQLLRGHFAFIEGRLNVRDRTSQQRWFDLAVNGKLFGNAQAESGPATASDTTLEIRRDEFVLNGTKYYSTGTLFADWIWATATLDGDHVGVALDATAVGVARDDDWDGFGQRLTGSGTTRFTDVAVAADSVIRFDRTDPRTHANITAFYQTVLLAALTGIGKRALDDAVEFVRGRTRTFGVPGLSNPREDPLVQSVIGRVASKVATVERLTAAAAADLDDVHQRWLDGGATADDYTRVQISVYEAQQIVVPTVIELTSTVFEVGGASATSTSRRLDRHWRNARTIGSHNPLVYRERAIGAYLLNGTAPDQPRSAATTGEETDAEHA